jgi:hypothetical protein
MMTAASGSNSLTCAVKSMPLASGSLTSINSSRGLWLLHSSSARAVGSVPDGGVRVRGLQVFPQHLAHEILIFDDQHSDPLPGLRQVGLGAFDRAPS